MFRDARQKGAAVFEPEVGEGMGDVQFWFECAPARQCTKVPTFYKTDIEDWVTTYLNLHQKNYKKDLETLVNDRKFVKTLQ